jgi:hypothetical protein
VAASILEAGVDRRRIAGSCVAVAFNFWRYGAVIEFFGRVAL